MKDVLEAALAAARDGEPAALVTVVATQGSTPQKAGAKMVVYPDGRIVRTIGGGCVEAEMSWRARQAIDARRPQVASYELTADQAGEDGLICGGRMEVFIEPLEATPDLAILGAGHVARPLCALGATAGFRVSVLDDREKYATTARFPEASRVVVSDFALAASVAAAADFAASTALPKPVCAGAPVLTLPAGVAGAGAGVASVLGRRKTM